MGSNATVKSVFQIIAVLLFTLRFQPLSAQSAADAPDGETEGRETGEMVIPMHLKIIWNLKDGTKDAKPVERNQEKTVWTTACAAIGRSLLVGEGPWGMGAFASFSCWLDDKKISGSAKGKPWTLEYKETDAGVSLVISDAESRKMSEVKYAPSDFSAYFFEDSEFVDLLAMKLLDGLPFMGCIRKGALATEDRFSGRYPRTFGKSGRRYPIVLPPKYLMGYRLERSKSGEVFRARVAGVVAQSSIDPDNAAPEASPKKTEKRTEPVVHWHANPELVTSNKTGFVWLHNAAGRDQMGVSLQAGINQAQKALSDAVDEGMLSGVFSKLKKGIRATTASGYVGVRYGPQVLSGDKLLSKTAFFGLIGEVRGGPLEGVRFYYDKLPQATVVQDGFDTSIAWGRFIVGKSFGLKLAKFADRLDLTPKLGVWNFHLKYPIKFNADETVSETGTFDLDRALSFALEAGVEWTSSWYILRTWYSFDGAAIISKVGSKRVTSNRAGLDTYWATGPKFSLFGASFKTMLLGFMTYEHLGITNTSTNETLTEGQSEITDLAINSGYLGLGLALSW